jgi:hypothetical protein
MVERLVINRLGRRGDGIADFGYYVPLFDWRGAASLGILGVAPARADEPILTDDGLYKQPWFIESFLDLSDDLEAAHKDGKRFGLRVDGGGAMHAFTTTKPGNFALVLNKTRVNC